jgi:hypothetical protein
MSDSGPLLEETIFQENVPGRWSRHTSWLGEKARDDGDDGDAHEPEEQTEEVTAPDVSHAHVPENVRMMIAAERAGKSQTGVKGVLADAAEAKALERAEQAARRLQREAILKRMVEGHKVAASQNIIDEANDDDDDDDDDEDDDGFMASFREKRLAELRQQHVVLQYQQQEQQASSNARFGFCQDVDSGSLMRLLEEQEKQKRSAAGLIVAHVYDAEVPTCARMNRILDELAPTMPNVQFVRMPASESGVPLDPCAMPILSLYQRGDAVSVLAGIAHDLGTDYFTRDQVEELLVQAASGR